MIIDLPWETKKQKRLIAELYDTKSLLLPHGKRNLQQIRNWFIYRN